MKFDFEFGVEIHKQLALISAVLVRLGQPAFFDNKDFVVDTASAGTYNLLATVASESNRVQLDFFMGTGLRIDLDGIPETFEWSMERLQNQPDVVSEFLYDLLRCYVLVQRSNKRIDVQLFDLSGQLVEAMNVRRLGFLRSFDPRSVRAHLFFPVYSPDSR